MKYYEECHGVIYVIDSSDERRLEESRVTFGEYKLLTVFQFNKMLRVLYLRYDCSIQLSCSFGSSFNHYYFLFNLKCIDSPENLPFKHF